MVTKCGIIRYRPKTNSLNSTHMKKKMRILICLLGLVSVNLTYGHYPVSPYAFCNGNPVNFVDPNGMEIEESSMKDWEKEKASIQRIMDKIQNQINKLVAKAGSKSRIANLVDRISGLNSTMETMGQLEASTQMYALASVGAGELGGLSYNHGTGIVTISYGGTANFVHEVTHGGQFEAGEIAFMPPKIIGQDVYDEIAAYKAQYAYDPLSVSGLTSSSPVRSSDDITGFWVQGLVYNGITPYGPGGSANTGIAPIGVNSNRDALIRAYPHLRQVLQSMPANITLRRLRGVYYKR